MSNSKPISQAQFKANLTKKNKYLKYPTAKLQQKLASKTLRMEALMVKVEDLRASIALIQERIEQTQGQGPGGDNEV